jgi:hypothetical protein
MTSPLGFHPPGAFIKDLIKSGFRKHGPVSTGDEFEIQI